MSFATASLLINKTFSAIHTIPLQEYNFLNKRSIIMSIKKLAIIVILVLALSACGNNEQAETTQSTAESTSEETTTQLTQNATTETELSLSSFITRYNSKIRTLYDISSEKINQSVTDEKYISCAKTLINKILKNPSGVQYNSASVLERDYYGRAIVHLDVSAQNSLGGWVRHNLYVCINGVNYDDTFNYNAAMYYTDNIAMYESLKNINDFGSNPDDKHIKHLLLEEKDFENIAQFDIAKDEAICTYKADSASGEIFIYTNAQTENIVSVKFNFDASKENNDFVNIISSLASVITDESIDMVSSEISNVFNTSTLTPASSESYFNAGYVFECAYEIDNLSVSVTKINKNDYETDAYWTPINESSYFEALTDKYMTEKNFEDAIYCYDLAACTEEKLLNAYYSYAELCLDKGDYDSARNYFMQAGSYKDSELRCLEVSYKTAQEYENNKNYKKYT